MTKGLFVKIPKAIRELTDEELFILALVQGLENKMKYVRISYAELLDYGGISKEKESKVVSALVNLSNDKRFKLTIDGKEIEANQTINKKSLLRFEEIIAVPESEKAFIQIFTWELELFIMQIAKSKRLSMFKQFVYIVGFINRSPKARQIAYPTIQSICDVVGKSDRTIRTYNEELESIKLLYSSNLVIEKETIKKVYSRYEHKMHVIEAISEAVKNGSRRVSVEMNFVPPPDTRVVKSSKSEKSKEGNDTSEELGRAITSLERCNLDFNGTLRRKIQEQIDKFGLENVVEFIREEFRLANGGIKDNNAYIMSKLKDENKLEKFKKSREYAKDAFERSVEQKKGVVYVNYLEELIEKNKNLPKKVEDSNERYSIASLFSLDLPFDDSDEF